MDCRFVRGKFTAFLDGDLRPAEMHWLEDHLAGCIECREELEECRVLLDETRDLLACPSPDYSFDALRERLAEIEPLEEVIAFLPKIRINHAVPRLAAAMLFAVIMGGAPFSLKNTRNVYQAMKSPFQARVDQWNEGYLDRMDESYRARFAKAPGGNDKRNA